MTVTEEAGLVEEGQAPPAVLAHRPLTTQLSWSGLVLGLGVMAGLRIDYASSGVAKIWFDSLQYIKVSHHPLWSLGLWAGNRPPLVPLMWKLTGTRASFMALQTGFAVVAWGFLSWTVWDRLGRWWRGVVGAWVVLAFSLTQFILLWDASVLSESISLSAVATLFAAGIWLCQRVTWPRALGFLSACLALGLARDEMVPVIGVLGVGLVLPALVTLRQRSGGSGILAVLAVLVLLASGLIESAALRSHRSAVNAADVLYVRVFPYPEKVSWFVAHGMPEGKQIDETASVVLARKPDLLADPSPLGPVAPVVEPVLANRYWRPLATWINRDGEATYLRYLVTHPGYVVSAPLVRPSLGYYVLSLAFYAARQPIRWTGWLFTGRLYLLIALAAALAGLFYKGTLRTRQAIFLMTLVPIGIFAMAIGWFGDSQEPARHMIEGNVMARLAILLLVLVTVLGPTKTGIHYRNQRTGYIVRRLASEGPSTIRSEFRHARF